MKTKAERRAEALERNEARKKRSAKEQLKLIEQRRGNSQKERDRLLQQTQEEANALRNEDSAKGRRRNTHGSETQPDGHEGPRGKGSPSGKPNRGKRKKRNAARNS